MMKMDMIKIKGNAWVVILILMIAKPMAFAVTDVSDESVVDAVTESNSQSSIALVYRGPGACLSCWVSAAQVARKAGFKVKFVNEHLKDFSVFKKAKMWVQPGGKSRIAAVAMGKEYLQQIRDFVEAGGGYVGFCAGAFLSTSIIGTSDIEGLGIIPGRTELWDEEDSGPQIAPLLWNGKVRNVYYSGGPFIDLMRTKDPDVNAFAFYENGKINAVTNIYGKGKVAVTGSHPEASKFWKFTRGQRDPDGSDQDLVIEMMRWATSP